MKDGILTADGTTLGSDNGVAVALMLMVLDDEDIVHPPVECVFTTEEEVGLNGARALDKSQISARTMINMDSEEEGVATISCAEDSASSARDRLQDSRQKEHCFRLKSPGLRADTREPTLTRNARTQSV